MIATFDGWIAAVHDDRSVNDAQAGALAPGTAVQEALSPFRPFVAHFGGAEDLAREYAAIIVRGRHDSAIFCGLGESLTAEVEAVLPRAGVSRAEAGARTVYLAYLGILTTASHNPGAERSQGNWHESASRGWKLPHNERMDADQADLLRQRDPADLGRRLRAARLARGMTQSEVAGDGMSVAYVSRMESGQRRPTVKALTALARKLEVPIEQLLGGVAPREIDEIRLTLDYAELSLESGEPHEASTQLREAIERLESSPIEGLTERASLLQARAQEALGHTDEAIDELNRLLGGRVTGLMRIKAAIALSRVYRESGDLGQAIDIGDRILAELEDSGLDSCDEAVQLAVTVAAAYFERGDAGHAVRVCRAAIAKAEALGSPTARASAYWNASVMQAHRGENRDAVSLAERALALLSEGRDARNLARLRTELGRLQLELDPPAVEEAQRNLEQAAKELAWSSAAPVDQAWTQLGLARVRFLIGDLIGTRELATTVQFISEGHAPLAEAEAKSLEGQSHAAEGNMTKAAAAYQQAVNLLSGIGADHGAAQLWFDLADLLDQVGMLEASHDAYKRAAASTGLRARTRAPARTFAHLSSGER